MHGSITIENGFLCILTFDVCAVVVVVHIIQDLVDAAWSGKLSDLINMNNTKLKSHL